MRPPMSGRKLILNELRLAAGARGLEIGCRVQLRVPQELEQVAVEIVGSRPHGHIDNAAGRLAQNSAEKVEV